VNEIKYNENNELNICLFFVQIKDSLMNQGNFATLRNLSSHLSTETVDLFSLDLGATRLQPWSENHISGK
jgi:hypothetical protein